MSIVRMPIADFVAELQAAVKRKDGYIMGARGQNPRTGSLDLTVTKVASGWTEKGWYFSQYTSSKQHAKALYWRKNCVRVWDCNGMAEGIYELFSGVNINTKARYNYANWCEIKGKGLPPEDLKMPGLAVFWGTSAGSIHHVGYLEKPVDEKKPDGDWYLIEARGVNYGVVRTKLNSRKPNFYGMMEKYFDYSAVEPVADDSVTPIEEVMQLVYTGNIKKGMKGDAVKALQEVLILLGYSCGDYGADGDFGKGTLAAVKAFQKDAGLTVDGIAGKKTIAAINEKLAVLT